MARLDELKGNDCKKWKRVSPEPLNQAHPLDPSLSSNHFSGGSPIRHTGSTTHTLTSQRYRSIGGCPHFRHGVNCFPPGKNICSIRAENNQPTASFSAVILLLDSARTFGYSPSVF